MVIYSFWLLYLSINLSTCLITPDVPRKITVQYTPHLLSNRISSYLVRPWTGYVSSNKSDKICFYNTDTLVFAEFQGINASMVNCEVLEPKSYNETNKVLALMKTFTKLVSLKIEPMLDFIEFCQLLDFKFYYLEKPTTTTPTPATKNVNLLAAEVYSVLVGIFPGTKWCGFGSVSANYFDLGKRRDLDACCRNHDLCPLRIKALTTHYNITNELIFSKLYCGCERRFYKCLKKLNNRESNLMGLLYFNLAQRNCIHIIDYQNYLIDLDNKY